LTASTDETGFVTMNFNMKEGWLAFLTNKLLNAKAIEEKMRIVQNKEKQIKLIKNLPKISSGQLMAYSWLRTDATILDNRRKGIELEDEANKVKKEKHRKVKNSQQLRYQAAINKCLVSKQALTKANFQALAKQSSKKGDSSMRKNNFATKRNEETDLLNNLKVVNMSDSTVLCTANTAQLLQQSQRWEIFLILRMC
jgi:hypothetical protein